MSIVRPDLNPRHTDIETVNYFAILSLLVYRLAKEFQIFELEQLGAGMMVWESTLIVTFGAKDLHLGVVPSDKFLNTFEVQELVILAFDAVIECIKETGEYEKYLPQ